MCPGISDSTCFIFKNNQLILMTQSYEILIKSFQVNFILVQSNHTLEEAKTTVYLMSENKFTYKNGT
jgi:NADH:ubiquinone oxidoreductase subunit K